TSSGLDLIAVAVLALWTFRLFPAGARVRRTALLSMGFLLLEALLGAGLVLLQYVASDTSVGRAIYLALHLTNTQLLLAFLTATAWWAGKDEAHEGTSIDRLPRRLVVALLLALLVIITGAIAALGDTLFPSPSLQAGVRSDFSPAAHFLVRLR